MRQPLENCRIQIDMLQFMLQLTLKHLTVKELS
jgi:hypothetical protein